MRLTAIEQPKSLLLKIAYYLSSKEFGKPLAALKQIYSRSTPILKASLKIIKTEKKLSIPNETRLFIRYYTSHLNNCPFCSNAIEFAISKQSIEFQQWQEFLHFKTSNKFTQKEKALLAYLEEVNFTKEATNETFHHLKQFYTEKEIVEITWMNATENYFNMMAKPLGLTSDNLVYHHKKV